MRIVFEGLPGAGKTTHVEVLAGLFSLPLVPEWVCFGDRQWRAYEPRVPFYFANDEIKDFIGGYFPDRPVLFDRHYTGALAYGYALSAVHGPDPSTGESYEANLAWYRRCIEGGLLHRPDAVFVLEIDAQTSLERQPRARGFDPLWGDARCLEAMRAYYRLFYEEIEAQTPCFWFDATRPLSEVRDALQTQLEALLLTLEWPR